MLLLGHRHERSIHRLIVAAALLLAALLLLPVASADAKKKKRHPRSRSFAHATYSSPITLDRAERYLWVVNSGAGSVTVIRKSSGTVVRTIVVGHDPQSVALDSNNRYAYVANAADGTVTVIKIKKATARSFNAVVDRRVGRSGALLTGAEPWNIVSSPDGRRIFVANSSQGTITVIDARRPFDNAKKRPRIIGTVDINNSVCNDPDRTRNFQPRGLAVTKNNKHLFVTAFLSFTRPGGVQGSDGGKEGAVCRLNINTKSKKIRSYKPVQRIALAPEITGFKIDSTGDGVPDDTSAFPNQLQSIVIRGNEAYLPNIAASPDGPLKFNVDTQAFVSVINNVNSENPSDAGPGKFINLHLGARDPEAGKKKLFFANPWAIAFTNRGGTGFAYVVSAASNLLVKVGVGADGKLSNTVDADTTRYIDLDDPVNPLTSGANEGINPQGIVINRSGTRAYVSNFISRNVTVVDLTQDKVIGTIRTASLPAPGTPQEVTLAGAEMFFGSRGNFNRPAGTNVSTSERLASDGWQACSSCHFKGLTDGVVWDFNAGPRKSIPLNATFANGNASDQRVLNYSAIFDEVEDFEANIRNVSGPGNLAAPVPCNAPAAGQPATGNLDPNHGLLIADNGDINTPPCVVNAFAKPNAGRPQLTLSLPGSTTQIPALTALKEWVRAAVRTPHAPFTSNVLRGGLSATDVAQGRQLFTQAGCATCHLGAKWTLSTKDFTSPPAATEIFTETTPAPPAGAGNPVGAQYLARFLRDIGSFNLGVAGQGNPLGNNIGSDEHAAAAVNPQTGASQPPQDALGKDYNGDGKGNGFNVPSLLGIWNVPPYYHNGACETLGCVLSDAKHRTANGTLPDQLTTQQQQALVAKFIESIDSTTQTP